MGNFDGKKAYTLVLSSSNGQEGRRTKFRTWHTIQMKNISKIFPMTIDDIFSNSLTSILNRNENEVKILPLNK